MGKTVVFPSGSFQKPSWLSTGGIILGVIALIVLFNSLVIVPAGHRLVVFNSFSGVEQRVLREGMNLLVPFIQSPIQYDVRTQTYNLSTVQERNRSGVDYGPPVATLTEDGQTVRMELSLRYRLVPSDVWKLHQNVGNSYVEKIIKPEVRSIVRETVSNFTVVDIYSSKRNAVQMQMQERIAKTLAKYHITVDELLIRDVQFSKEFTEAIEQKQVALQAAERMRYVLQKEEAEKKRKIIEAQGVAESMRVRAEALRQNPKLIQYEYVQKLTPGVKAIITDQNSIINLGELLDDKKR